MIDLARELPSTTKFYGFDIDLGQCPPAESFPSNVHISQWDMFTPPPSEIIGTFDVVHLRLVTLVIKDNDPTTLIANVGRLLSTCVRTKEAVQLSFEACPYVLCSRY